MLFGLQDVVMEEEMMDPPQAADPTQEQQQVCINACHVNTVVTT